MKWIANNWLPIVGTIASLIGAAYIPIIRTIVVKGFKSLLSEAFLKQMFLSLADKYVASTKTKLDDVWLAQLKKKL